MAFRGWANSLAPDVEVWHVTLPGPESRAPEPFVREWDTLPDQLADAIVASVAAPVALFGHSLGALVAFEVTRALARTRAAPTHLVVSARGAPDGSSWFEVPSDDETLLRHLDELYGGVPNEVRAEPDVLAYFLPILRADLELVSSYVFTPGPLLECPITAIAGADDRTVSQSELARWYRQTSASFELRRFPGGHFYFETQQDAVLETIALRLLR